MKQTITLWLFFITLNSAFCQELIEGIVHDEFGTLENANVLVKGTTKGVSTNENGNFELAAKLGDTISISYLGYKAKTIVVSKKERYDILLDTIETLDEVSIFSYKPSKNSLQFSM